MATASQNQITVTEAYVDITVANAGLASADVLIQNLDDDTVDVVCGASASGKGPIRLDSYDSVQVNAANIWVRGTGHISATLV